MYGDSTCIKIIQFQIRETTDSHVLDELEHGKIYGLGDNGIVYYYDKVTKAWIVQTQNKFRAQ